MGAIKRCGNKCVRKLRRCSGPECVSARTQDVAIILAGVGTLLMTISMFIPRWRVDPIGTKELQDWWLFDGFESRSYGLLQVKGTFSQSWSTISNTMCQMRDLMTVANIGQSAVNLVSSVVSGDTSGVVKGCAGSQQCSSGYSTHLQARCYEYEKLYKLSSAVMGCCFVGILMCAGGTLLAGLSNRKKTGGITFGLYLFAGGTGLVLNILWAAVSDASFKKMAESAWYPYPSLGIGWFLHLYGCLLLLIANGVFGYIILPESWEYDPQQAKIDKRFARLQRLKGMMGGGRPMPQQQYHQQQGPAAMNFPAPPGFQSGGAYVNTGPAPMPKPPCGGGGDFGMSNPGAQQYGHTACAPPASHPPQSGGHWPAGQYAHAAHAPPPPLMPQSANHAMQAANHRPQAGY